MSIVRITGAWTQLLLAFLDTQQLAAADLRRELQELAHQEVVAISVWHRLLEQTAALCPQLIAPGLAIGALVEPRHVGVLGYLALTSSNLAEAMLVYQRYERLFYGVDLVELAYEGDQVELRWPRDARSFNALTDSLAIAALVSFLRRQIENPPPPTLISFVHPYPGALAAQTHADFFGCPVHFADSHTRVRFPIWLLNLPMPQHDPGLRDLLARQAQALLQALPSADDFETRLQQILVAALPEGRANLEFCADHLSMSPRSLQRQLKTRSLSFQDLLDRTRNALAEQYLCDPVLSLVDIALLLGYSEQSAFNRAFRRWKKLSPLAWRQQQEPTPR